MNAKGITNETESDDSELDVKETISLNSSMDLTWQGTFMLSS